MPHTLDHPLTRASFTCPRCQGAKDRHLLICWPCHRMEKAANNGGYSDECDQALDAYEAALRRAL